MRDEDKTKSRLIDELSAARERIAELEAEAEAACAPADRLPDGTAKYRMVWKNSGDMITFHSAEDLAFLAANPATCEVLGYREEELVGRPAPELVHPEDREEAEAAGRKVAEDGSASMEVRVRRADGSYIWVAVAGRRVVGADQRPVLVGIGRDVTERKETEQRLKRYEMAVEGAGNIMAAINTDCEYVLANRAFLQHWKLQRDEVIGHTVAEVLGREVFEQELKPHVDRCFEGREVNFEICLRDPQGRRRWSEVIYYPLRSEEGAVTGLVGVIRNITSEKRLERQQQTTVALLQLLNSGRPIGETAQRAARLLADHCECEAAAIRLRKDGRFPLVGAVGEADLCDRLSGGAEHPDECLCARVLTGVPPAEDGSSHAGFRVADVRELSGGLPADCPLRGAAEARSVAMVRLRAEGNTFGIVQLFDRDRASFGEEEFAFLGRLTDSLGMGLAHKRAQEKLERSEERFRTVLEGMRDVAYKIDLRSGRFDYVSPAVEQICGYAVEEVMEMGQAGTHELVHPDDRERLQEVTQHLLEDRRPGWREPTLEFRVRHKDGHYVWMSARRKVVRSEDGQPVGLVGLVRDVTDRKRVEETLRRTQDSPAEVPPRGVQRVYVKDAELRFAAVNQEAAEVLDVSPEEAVGKTDFDFWSDELAEKFRGEDLRVLESGEPERTVEHTPYGDGRTQVREYTKLPLFGEGGQVAGLVVVQSEMDALDRADALLSHWAAVASASADAILGLTLRGRIASWNPAFERMYGYEDSEVQDLALRRLSPSQERPKLQRALEEAGRGRDVRGLEAVQVREDGERFHASITLSPIFSPADEVAAVSMIVRDTTERKRAEQKLLRYQERLRTLAAELSRAEEKERRRIASELHDGVGQALTVAAMKLGLLEGATSPKFRKTAREVHTLVEQALEAARTLTFQLSPPILHDLGFAPAVEWLSEQFEERHGLRTDFHDDARPKPLAEEVGIVLFKAVRELLFNVVKHADAGRAEVSLESRDESVRVRVEDDGVGFEQEGERQAASNSFGLFSMRERLASLGGRVEIDSAPGEGTRVTLHAPMNPKSPRRKGGER